MNHIVPNFLQSYPFFKWVGAFFIGVKLMKIFLFVLRKISYHAREICGLSYLRTDIGKWAVITGGTDGIGKAYAEELARKGFSICLISRNAQKLNSVAIKIEEKYHVDTKTVHADFTDDREIYKVIERELKELDGGIGVLVNNVGMSYKYAEYFHSVPGGANFMMDLINSNIKSCTMMMKIAMPDMLKRKGVIINISSLMAVYPMPFLATYAACKAYVDHLSRAVQYEYKNSGIIVQSVLPGYVATKMSNRRPRLEVPQSTTFVSSAIKTVGFENYTYGYVAHKVRGFVHEWLKANMPECINMAISVHIMKNNRESYYRKQQRKKLQEKNEQN